MAGLRNRLTRDQRIFFPWEGRSGLRRFLVLGRVGPAIALVLSLQFVWWVGTRERTAAGERRTRVALHRVRNAVEAYLAEHDEGCPPRLEDVLPYLNQSQLPVDAWGQPFRLVCPGDHPGDRFILMSDGPDGFPGGLDRIEF